MLSVAELEILLKARDEATRVLTQAEGRMGAWAKTVDRFVRPALLATTIAASALIGGIGLFVRAAMEGQVSSARLEQAIKATGMAFDSATQESVERFVKSLENMTGFSDTEVRDALATLVFQTGDVEESMVRLRIAADFARGAKISLGDAARLLGKITDETVTVLARYGIQVDKNATATEVLALVQERFSGQSAAYADTLQGKWEKVQNRFRDFVEQVGGAFLPVLESIADKAEEASVDLPKLADGIEKWIKLNPGVVQAGIGIAAASAGVLGLSAAVAFLGAALASPVVTVALFTAAVMQIAENVIYVQDNWDMFVYALRTGKLNDIPVFGFLFHEISGALNLLDAFRRKWDEVWGNAQTKVIVTPGGSGQSGFIGGSAGGGGGGGGGGSTSGTVYNYSPPARSSNDRPATLDDMYAAYVRNHGSTPPQSWYTYANQLLAMGPYWSEVQGMAQGGVVSARNGGSIVRVGEAGVDEVIAPLDRYSVVPRGTSGGDGLHVHFHGPVYGMSDFEDAVKDVARTFIGSGGLRGMPGIAR